VPLWAPNIGLYIASSVTFFDLGRTKVEMGASLGCKLGILAEGSFRSLRRFVMVPP
jgi:hypothetical protein